MTIGFRSVFHIARRPETLDLVKDALRSWLIEKGHSVESSFEVDYVHRRDAQSAYAFVNHPEENSPDWLVVLIEENSGKTWKVSVALHDDQESDSDIQVLIEVDVTPADLETAIDLIETPRFAKRLIEQLSVTDGAVRIIPGVAAVSTQEQIQSLVRDIQDPGRRIAISVAPSPEQGIDEEWSGIVSRLTSRGAGNSSTYVLDADLTKVFNSMVPKEFGVGLGTVRTYMPGIDLSDASSSGLHRFLRPMKLAKSIYRVGKDWMVAKPLQNAFNMSSRLQFMQIEVPGALTESWTKLVQRSQALWLKERLPSKNPGVAEIAGQIDWASAEISDLKMPESFVLDDSLWNRLANFVQKFTGHSRVSAETLQEVEQIVDSQSQTLVQIEELMYDAETKRLEALREVEELKKFLNTNQSEIHITSHRVRYLENENKRLRSSQLGSNSEDAGSSFDFRSLDQGIFCEDIAINLQEEGPPEFAKLREFVVFTGDPKQTRELDSLWQSADYIATIWDYIEVLHDYARTKSINRNFTGGVDHYLKNPGLHGGKTTGPINHSTEGERTRDEFGHLRIFPVPRNVASGGRIAMWSHFKIAQLDTNAPRLHYFDDSSGTGKIYIGYIGKHLKNTKTN